MSAFKAAWISRRRWWTGAGVVALVVSVIMAYHPAWADLFYGHYVFGIIRWLFRYSLGLIPFPALYVVVGLSLLLLWQTAGRALARRRWNVWTCIAGIVSTAGALVFLFQVLWGFNYSRPGFSQRMRLQDQHMTREQLSAEFQRATNALTIATADIDSQEVHTLLPGKDYEKILSRTLAPALEEFGFPSVARPRVRIIYPKGILMRLNTAGVYLPFTGEGQIDAGMLPVQIPFTMAHEMSHGYGVTDEGDCNFTAYLACSRSEDPYIRFAGLFTYWRYVATSYKFAEPDQFRQVYEHLPHIVLTLLKEIHANDAKYPDFFPRIRNAIYDSYLKTQGVHAGLMSYSKVVELVAAYESRQTPE